MVVPLRVGTSPWGHLSGPPTGSEQDVGLLKIFANQATVAIHNAQLYEMAALDPLTGVHARRFLEQWLRREVRTAFRAQKPLSMLMIDMDNMQDHQRHRRTPGGRPGAGRGGQSPAPGHA